MSALEPPIVLSIAGSDSGGGAGIQADIKAIAANGGFATTAITALTAQNTQRVSSIVMTSPEMLEAQIEAVFEDFQVAAVKIGMVGNDANIRSIGKMLERYKPRWVVLDPVMVSTSGSVLLEASANERLIQELSPLCDLITPNLDEAKLILDSKEPIGFEGMEDAARELAIKCQTDVLLKGGHLSGNRIRDLLLVDEEVLFFDAEKIASPNMHGTGCTLSAAIAAHLALSETLQDSVKRSLGYVRNCIQSSAGWTMGKGAGPLNHFPNHR